MTEEQYYELLRLKHKQTNWNDLQSIKEYTAYARLLRRLMEQEDESK